MDKYTHTQADKCIFSILKSSRLKAQTHIYLQLLQQARLLRLQSLLVSLLLLFFELKGRKLSFS